MRTLTVLTVAATLALAGCTSGDDTGDVTGDDTAAEAPADDSGTDEATDDGGDDAAAAGGSLTFTGTDDISFEETQKSTSPGSVEVTLECGEALAHTLAFEGVQGGEAVTDCSPGGSGSATVELEAGDYTYFCTIPGHREQGMEGTLTVG